MAKRLVKYKMHGEHIPWYIEEPMIELDGWLVGLTKDDSKCYIPPDIQDLTKQDFKSTFTSKDIWRGGKQLSKKEKDDYIDEILKGKV
jgi:hypothetical protein